MDERDEGREIFKKLSKGLSTLMFLLVVFLILLLLSVC